MKINEQIRDEIMRELGHKEKHLGTDMIRAALAKYEPGMKITGELYPAIARAYNTTPIAVERNIRNSIQAAWVSSSGFAALRYFPDDLNGGWPTNMEYIATMVRLCRDSA